MALADCSLRSSQVTMKMQEVFLQIRNTIGIPTLFITLLCGSIVLTVSKAEKTKYPYVLIVSICFFQAMSM